MRSLLALAIVCAAGCDSAYYAVMDRFGQQKRDIMVDRVEDARDAQKDAQEQFTSALDKFRSVVDTDGGDLEKRYDQLQQQYDGSEVRAKAVSKRIADVRKVADDLFVEWEGELAEYKSAELKRTSAKQLQATKQRYTAYMKQMEATEREMQPVLAAFHDQVLFLKHNLNAIAVGSIKNEHTRIAADVQALINDMEGSIKEADSFVDAMKNEPKTAPNS